VGTRRDYGHWPILRNSSKESFLRGMQVGQSIRGAVGRMGE